MEATAVTEVVTAAVEVVDAVAVVVAVSGEDGKQLHKYKINHLINIDLSEAKKYIILL